MKKIWILFLLSQSFFVLGLNFKENVSPEVIVVLLQGGMDEDLLSENLLQNDICYRLEDTEKKYVHTKKTLSHSKRLNQWSKGLNKKQLSFLNKTTTEEIQHYYINSKMIIPLQIDENKEFFIYFSDNFEKFLTITQILKKVSEKSESKDVINEIRDLFHLLLNGKELLISNEKIEKIKNSFFARYSKELIPIDVIYNKIIGDSQALVELPFLVNSIENKILNKTYQDIDLKLAVQKIFVIWYDLLDSAIKKEDNFIRD